MKIFYCKNFKEKNKYLKYQYSEKNLTTERLERMKLIKEQDKRERFLMSEFITMELLERMYGIKEPKIRGKAGEKPWVNQIEKINFSRSYADENLVVAIEVDYPIGVDCATIMPKDDKVMEYFFTKEEKDYVASADDKDLAFTVIWTRKESYMKYTGEGMMMQFQLLNTAPEDFDNDHVDTVSSKLISEAKLENSQKIEGCYVKKDDTFVENHSLFLKSFVVNNTVISVTGEEPSMRKIAYQEKRTYEEKNNRLFWKNSQNLFEKNSSDGSHDKTDL